MSEPLPCSSCGSTYYALISGCVRHERDCTLCEDKRALWEHAEWLEKAAQWLRERRRNPALRLVIGGRR